MDPSRLVCVGQLTADTFVALDSPLAVGDQVRGVVMRSLGGTAAIAAHNAACWDLCPVSFTGHVGPPRQGPTCPGALQAVGVDLGGLLAVPEQHEVLILVEPSGQRSMVAGGEEVDWSPLAIHATRGDIVLFEGWHLFEPSTYEQLISRARATGARIAIDVCSASRAADPRVYARRLSSLRPDILFANELEAAVFGLEPGSKECLTVVHRGERPTHVWEHGRLRRYEIDAVSAVDTTGAGDTFAGVMLAALVAGYDLDGALDHAHAAARAVVMTPGSLLMSRRPVAAR